MFAKSFLLITVSVFVSLSLSCYSTKQISADSIILPKEKEFFIIGVMKNSGEYIIFPEYNPAIIYDNAVDWKRNIAEKKVIIQGEEKDFESLSIALSEVDKLQISILESGKSVETWYKVPNRKVITAIRKITGENIKFPINNPARVSGNYIVWKSKELGETIIVQDEKQDLESFSIPLSEVDHIQTRNISAGAIGSGILIILAIVAGISIIGFLQSLE